ncbi:MAG TPA: formylglycine-generating enzyme family protein, partial [Myxococcota bacterium]|nr:formylglycine-generating enzyme family protein [Myxococcota bacterium]
RPAAEELEDGPPQEGGLLAIGPPSALRVVTRPERVLDTLGPMVDLPAGRLFSQALPEQDVEPLRVMVVPVTEAVWARVMGEARGHWRFPLAPVTEVSWFDAVRLCNRASDLAGYARAYDDDGRWRPEADGFRLPTEAEWEYACRAGTRTPWSWGEDAARAVGHAWFGDNAGGRAHAVGRLGANPWGLYDMHGDVWEWCGSVVDGRRSVDNPDEVSTRGSRALRGGSFVSSTRVLRSSDRDGDDPSFEFWYIGFRCVRGVRRQMAP